MPSISMFFGIVIYMYADDHNPPHVHAIYQGMEVAIDLDGNVLAGSIPRKQLRLITAWIEIHHEELLVNWDLAQRGDSPYRIDPLR